jgi:hypothetical protein
VLFFVVFVLFPNKFNSSAYTSNLHVSFSLHPALFSWTFLIAYSKAKISGVKTPSCFALLCVGNVSGNNKPSEDIAAFLTEL